MIKYVPAKHYQKANREAVQGIVIHTAETPETDKVAENLQSWTAGPNANVSSWHYAVDNDSITQSVLEKDIAWHAGPANGWTIGIELAGRARQKPEEWADEYSQAVLERAAHLVADICVRHGISVVRLNVQDLKAGKRKGIFGHVDVTNAFTEGKGHTDPGPHFPWDSFIRRVRELAQTLIETKPIPLPKVVEPNAAPDLSSFVEVEHKGVTWLVCPVYIAPVGIGQARDIAKSLGCELPSPGLVDAIWKAADMRIDASIMPLDKDDGMDGTATTMNGAEAHAKTAAKIARQIGDWSVGKDFFLLAGAFKDVVVKDGKIGLYGWHRADGSVIQPFYSGHALAWVDYSQGLRLVRRK